MPKNVPITICVLATQSCLIFVIPWTVARQAGDSPGKNTGVYCHFLTVVHISHASKVVLKIIQSRLQNQELSDIQARFRKF